MAILYGFDGSGGFLAGDTDTGRTCYAYPTSASAVSAAKSTKNATRIAEQMMLCENDLGEWRDSPEYRNKDASRIDILG